MRWIVHDVETQRAQPPWCVFFGDDVTDEDAFRAVRGLTVVVGRRPSGARYRLELAGRCRRRCWPTSSTATGTERSTDDDVR